MRVPNSFSDTPPFSGELKELDLKPIYKEIWDRAKPLLAIGRHWDLWHTEISIGHMQEILAGEGREDLAPALIPSLILHDIGWSELGDEKNKSWDSHELRVKHMKIGARLAENILNDVGYDGELTKEIVNLVATHDNAYLGIEPKTVKEKLLRDADACFILTYPSFWKDYHVKGKNISIEEFESQFEKYGKRYTETAQKITDGQIGKRREEIKDVKVSPEERYREIQEIVEKKKASI